MVSARSVSRMTVRACFGRGLKPSMRWWGVARESVETRTPTHVQAVFTPTAIEEDLKVSSVWSPLGGVPFRDLVMRRVLKD
jgi:hypothetical protein